MDESNLEKTVLTAHAGFFTANYYDNKLDLYFCYCQDTKGKWK